MANTIWFWGKIEKYVLKCALARLCDSWVSYWCKIGRECRASCLLGYNDAEVEQGFKVVEKGLEEGNLLYAVQSDASTNVDHLVALKKLEAKKSNWRKEHEVNEVQVNEEIYIGSTPWIPHYVFNTTFLLHEESMPTTKLGNTLNRLTRQKFHWNLPTAMKPYALI